MLLHDGTVLSRPSFDAALEALVDPAEARSVRLAKVISRSDLDVARVPTT
jgi:hypothetical protein